MLHFVIENWVYFFLGAYERKNKKALFYQNSHNITSKTLFFTFREYSYVEKAQDFFTNFDKTSFLISCPQSKVVVKALFCLRLFKYFLHIDNQHWYVTGE